MKQNLHDRLITIFSFFAGTGLAAAALIGYGFIVPIAGSGFWVKQLCVLLTLSAVAAGSFTGALVSEYKRNDKLLLLAVLISGLLLMLLPFYSNWVHSLTGPLQRLTPAILYGVFVLFLPVALISQVIPLTIAGLRGGSVGVYARKTGIVFSVVMMGVAFGSIVYPVWLIPALGLIGSSMMTGFVLAIIPAIQIFRQGWKKPGILAIAIAILLQLTYAGTGMAGDGSVFITKKLGENWQFSQNGTWLNGTWYSDTEPKTEIIGSAVQQLLENSFPETEVLLMGCSDERLIGTGIRNNLHLTILDNHQILVEKALGSYPQIKILPDELYNPRNFLNSVNVQYDLVILDLMRGDDIPVGIFTAESVMKIRGILKPGGLGVIRLPDIPGNAIHWYGTKSLFKTIRALGLFTEISLPGEQEPSLILFSGSRDAFDDRLDAIGSLKYYPLDSIQVEEVRILTDNRPLLGLYFYREMAELRRVRLGRGSQIQPVQ